MRSRGWELVGRGEELARCLDVLRGPGGGMVLAGAAGVGKSRLVQQVVDELPDGWSTERVVATHGSRAISFGALSHLLADGGPASEPDDPPSLLWVMRRIRSALADRAAGRPLLLAVDDAHLLDEASAALVQQMAITGEATLLATVRSGDPCPEPILALWRDQVCEHLELRVLSRNALGEMAAQAFDRWFDAESTDRLHAVSGGNPLFLRELLLDAHGSGAITEVRDLLHWEGVVAADRLGALVDREVEGLATPAREAIDLLAIGDPLPLAVAEALIGLEVLADLEEAGRITVDALGDRRVRLGHPLFGEVRRVRMATLHREILEARLADAFERAGAMDADDGLRVVAWQLSGRAEVAAERLADAALHARSRGDDAMAERLAREARGRQAEPPGPLDLLLAEICELSGRPEEADGLLDGLVGRLTDDRDRARALSCRIRVNADQLDRLGAATAAVEGAGDIADPSWRGYVEAQWATALALFGEIERVEPVATALFDQPDDRIRLRVLGAVNLCAIAAGRIERGLAAAQSMVGPALALRDQVPSGVSVVFSALCLDLLVLGRLDDLDDLLARAEGEQVMALPANRAHVLLLAGAVALRRGQVATARRHLTDAVVSFDRYDPYRYRRLALSLLAEACARAGDRRGARAADVELDAFPPTSRPSFIDADVGRARCWVWVADGDPAEARRRLRSLAAEARSQGWPVLEVLALHDLARLGASSSDLARLAEVAAQVDGELSAAAAAHALGLLADDPEALAEVSARFEALGQLLVAAEVAAQSTEGFARRGRPRAARRQAARAQALLARCEGAVATVDLAVDRPALTPREQQVARMAASGRASRAIAAELGVSPRTVDNQLSRVYAKLGISNRTELVEVLDG